MLNMVGEVALGMHYIHTAWEAPVLHLDLKSANVLIDYKGIAKSRAKEHLPQGHTKEDRIKVISAWERQPCTNASAWQDKHADFDTASANMTEDQKICFRKLQSEFDVFLVHGMRCVTFVWCRMWLVRHEVWL